MTEDRNDNSRELSVAALHDALDVYVAGRSGLRFEALMRFAGPLFDLYDVEWRAVDQRDALARDADELATMVAVLDTARLLWAFFELHEESSIEMLPDIEDAMLGRGAGDEERSNLLVLLSLLEEHWQSFTVGERADAVDTPGYVLPAFDVLLAEYQGARRRLPKRDVSMYGSEDLELPEALAVFAEPLLRQPALEDDADLIEERVERAQAYWELATAPAEEFDAHLQRIVDAYAETEGDEAEIRQEARDMLERFQELFPDRATGSH